MVFHGFSNLFNVHFTVENLDLIGLVGFKHQSMWMNHQKWDHNWEYRGLKGESTTGWCPPVISWYINPII